jgi:hypothetical protein
LIAIISWCLHTSAFPINQNDNSVFRRASAINDASGDLWASVVANVAPLMALVGERNVKEYMRVASSRTQLALMASAPLGILSVLVSTVRLSGPRLLRRLLGRESDRRSEALVELTPLSIEPATSAYTAEGVEIEPAFNRDRVAFVCGHVQKTQDVTEAAGAFKSLTLARNGKVDASRDFETILALRGLDLTLQETAQLVTTLTTASLKLDPKLLSRASSASLSFRTTGISPSQTTFAAKTWYGSMQRLTHTIAAFCFFCLMVGIQILAFYVRRPTKGNTQIQALFMGISGYVGIAVCSFFLLTLLQGEVHVESQELPKVFNKAMWTISDARHAEHRLITMPAKATLAIARPSRFTPTEKRKRQGLTFFLTLALVASYVTYYLGLRAAPWWVGLSHVGFIWLAAAYRATITKNTLVAREGELGEHWLGTFRDTLYDSLLAMTQVLEQNSKTIKLSSKNINPSLRDEGTSAASSNAITSSHSRLLLSVKPIRQSLRNWSGCEDVMKVALALAKQACRERICVIPYVPLQPPHFDSIPGGKYTSWGGVFRFKMMLYVPGMVWTAHNFVDYVRTEQEFDMPNLYRDIFKLIHLCSDYQGEIKHHEVSQIERQQLSDTLCGPIHLFNQARVPASMTLSKFLVFLRDAQAGGLPGPKAYSLEQAILLPTIQLAVMYEATHSRSESVIETYQNQHIDRLGLSGGGKWLHVLDGFLDRQGVWSEFMAPKNGNIQSLPKERDATSGLYQGGFGNNQESQWLHADRVGVSYEKNVVEFR